MSPAPLSKKTSWACPFIVKKGTMGPAPLSEKPPWAPPLYLKAILGYAPSSIYSLPPGSERMTDMKDVFVLLTPFAVISCRLC